MSKSNYDIGSDCLKRNTINAPVKISNEERRNETQEQFLPSIMGMMYHAAAAVSSGEMLLSHDNWGLIIVMMEHNSTSLITHVN